MLKIPALYLCLLMSGSAWALGPPAAMTEAECNKAARSAAPRSLIGAAPLDLDG